MCAPAGAGRGPSASSPSSGLPLLVEVVVNDIEHALPDRALAFDPVDRLADCVEVEAQAVGATIDRSHHQPGLLEHLDVLRDRGLGDAEAAGCLPDGRRPAGESLHDPAPDWVGQGLEGIVSHYANYIGRASFPSRLGRSPSSSARIWTPTRSRLLESTLVAFRVPKGDRACAPFGLSARTAPVAGGR